MSRDPIRSILIAGDGIVGLSAALAFSRALPSANITLLSLPEDRAALADHFPGTLPAIGRFHASIGFDELDLVRRGIAVHHLGTRFAGGAHGDWIHSFGDVGRGEGVVPFHAIWLAAKRKANALPYDRYAPASVIGRAGKFVHPSGDPTSPLASYLYGLRLHPSRYRDALLDATRLLLRIAGPIAAIERRDDGGIKSLTLADGATVNADLYLDCSGAMGALIGAGGNAVEDWSAWLPARHVDIAWDGGAELEPLDVVGQIATGWQLTATVPDSTLRASVTTEGSASSVTIRPGRRREPFIGNVLALGDAALALDPLHGANLSLAHSAILRAIDLIPGRDCHPLELAEYNRLTALEVDRARDYHILFQSQRPDAAPPPESLARTIVQWRARGRLPFFEEETFTASDWTQALIGLDLLPDAIAPQAGAIDPSVGARAMAGFAAELDALASRLPDYREYLVRIAQNAAGHPPR